LKQARPLVPILVILFVLAVMVGLVWSTYRFTAQYVSGAGFSINWIGIHALISNGENPYSNAVTKQIQAVVKQQNSFAPGIQAKYNSPLFSGIIVFPFAMVGNPTIARALWLSLQLLAIFAIMIIGLRLTSWSPPWYIFLLFSIITIFSYHIVVPWLDGGLAIWSALFLVSSLLALSQNRNEMAGILLALSAIQPQMVILPIIFILIWAVSQKRRISVLWFFITLIFLSVLGLFLVPDWIIQYLRLMTKFQQNFPLGSPGVLFQDTWPGLGKQLGWLLSASLIIILLFEWWLAFRKEFRWFLWTVCLTMVISQWIGIPTIPANFVMLLLPLILISAMLSERWPRGGGWVVVIACILLFAWEWALLYSDLLGNRSSMQLNMIIPLPLISLIGLYWVRWWAIKPRRLLVQELRFGESY
jgi:hypothetical protein